MKIYTKNEDNQYVYIDVGEGNQVVDFMRRNSIFVDKFDGDIATFNTLRMGSRIVYHMLSTLVEFYVQNGWEVSEEVFEIVKAFREKAEEGRQKNEAAEIEGWEREQARRREAKGQADPILFKARMRQRGSRLRMRTDKTDFSWIKTFMQTEGNKNGRKENL